MFKLITICIALFLAVSNAFGPAASSLSRVQSTFIPARSAITPTRSTRSSLRMSSEAKYWEGDWICADCGYIYDRDDCGGMYFEEQKKGFICPQCRGPRRRFAKKVGDKVGITQDGGDAQILLFSFIGFAATVAFGVWFSQQ